MARHETIFEHLSVAQIQKMMTTENDDNLRRFDIGDNTSVKCIYSLRCNRTKVGGVKLSLDPVRPI
jgi:hypothetical protein